MAKKRKIQKKMKRKSSWNKNRLVALMAIIIIVLAIVVVYSFAIRPSFNGYVVEKQNEARDVLLNALLSQLYQNGYIQIPLSNDEVLTLVPYQPQQEISQEVLE